ncbi:hypothetical protein BD408DRAFT_442040 [Parasitella parasitica]|nr:hypothetical protein BD408DRAFT_442040 [Parasitella parasitica]
MQKGESGLLGGFVAPSRTSRRSRYVLDESSLKKARQFNPATEASPFQRKHPPLAPLCQHRHHLYPLAQPNTAADATTCSNTSSSWEGDDDSKEDFFPLDEDIQALGDSQSAAPDRWRSNTPRNKRRPSRKCIDFEEEKDDKSTKTNAYHQKQDRSLATPVPITLKDTAFSVRSKMENMQSSVQKHPSPSNSVASDRKPCFKSSMEIALSPHYTTMNDNPQHSSSNKNKIELELAQDENDQDEAGSMIPPHILTANAVTDEAETIFDSVPRNSIRHRPLE